jgi:Cu-processing system permease protein
VSRNRWIFIYGILLFLITFAFIHIAGDFLKAALSLSSILVVLVPLTSVLFTTIYWYYSDRFTELLLTQPIPRLNVYLARIGAITVSLGTAFALALTVPFLILGGLSGSVLLMAATGLFLTVVFTTLGMLFGVLLGDRMKGVGLALGLWFYFAILHDGLILILLLVFRDYPMDLPAGILGALNPIGLARVVLLMSTNASMLLGHTGALVRSLLTSSMGYVLATLLALTWMTIPIALGMRAFRRRDF